MKGLWHRMWAVLLAAVLAACGGVGTDGTGESSVHIGMATGLADDSVTVNDVVYERGGAVVTDAFDQVLGGDALRLGMWLEVTGTVDEVTGRAVAQSIRVRPALRGQVSAVDGAGLTLTVLESTVRYDNVATVIDGADSAALLAPGDVVEVHGPLGASAGNVEASRIERLSAAPTPQRPFELRGRVSSLDAAARTLTVGRQAVRYDTATLALRQALANGQVVRVTAGAPPVAGLAWRVERMSSDQPLPDNLGFVYAEGVTTDWVTGPTFAIEGVSVDATTANGRGAVTANGQRVAVIGSLASGAIRAKSVARSVPGQPVVFVLSGALASYVSVADFRVRGVGIDASAATFVGGTAAELSDGRRVRVVGSVSGRRLIATRVEFL